MRNAVNVLKFVRGPHFLTLRTTKIIYSESGICKLFFWEGPESNWFSKVLGPSDLFTAVQLCRCSTETSISSTWIRGVWLCSNKTLWIFKFEFHVTLMCHKVLFFCFYLLLFKVVNTILQIQFLALRSDLACSLMTSAVKDLQSQPVTGSACCDPLIYCWYPTASVSPKIFTLPQRVQSGYAEMG